LTEARNVPESPEKADMRSAGLFLWELPNLMLQDGTQNNIQAMAGSLQLDIILLESIQRGDLLPYSGIVISSCTTTDAS